MKISPMPAPKSKKAHRSSGGAFHRENPACNSAPATAPSNPNGRLTEKDHAQGNQCTIIPPANGPTSGPINAGSPQTASPAISSERGKVRTSASRPHRRHHRPADPLHDPARPPASAH